MDKCDLIHWRRSLEEREALLRDISCRRALGLPTEEPGKNADGSYFGKDKYNPDNPLFRYDYWGEPKKSKLSRQQRMTNLHNKKIVGRGSMWYEMSYEDFVKEKLRSEALGIKPKQYDEDSDSDEDSDENFDLSILDSKAEELSDQLVANGAESSRFSDEGTFDD